MLLNIYFYTPCQNVWQMVGKFKCGYFLTNLLATLYYFLWYTFRLILRYSLMYSRNKSIDNLSFQI
jgi:hypothetical protein